MLIPTAYSLLEVVAHLTSAKITINYQFGRSRFLKPEELDFARRSGAEPLKFFLKQAGQGGGGCCSCFGSSNSFVKSKSRMTDDEMRVEIDPR
jgi:hypothetical protein